MDEWSRFCNKSWVVYNETYCAYVQQHMVHNFCQPPSYYGPDETDAVIIMRLLLKA